MKQINWKLFGLRIVCYAIGLLFLAFGVAFSVNSNLGVSPVNSLPYVVSLIVQKLFGLAENPLGTCVTVVFSLYVVIQILLLRKDFKWINLTQVLFSTLFGYFTNFSKDVLSSFTIPTYFGQLVMLAISIVLVAIGVVIYMGADLVNMPMEGMTVAINTKLMPKLTFRQTKVIMDCSVVVLGIILSFIFLGGLFGIREGTVLCALLVGPCMKPVSKIIKPLIRKICFGDEEK